MPTEDEKIKTPNKHKCSRCGKGNSDRLYVRILTGATSQNPLKSTEEKLRILGILFEPHKVSHKDGIFTVKYYYHNECEFKVKHYGMGHKKWNEWNREYKKVRPLVLERDNNTCQVCKGKSDKLFKKNFKIVVHHIKKVKDRGSNDLNNLLTLCQPCNIVIDHGILAIGAMKAIGRKPTDKECEKHKKMILKRYQNICDKI